MKEKTKHTGIQAHISLKNLRLLQNVSLCHIIVLSHVHKTSTEMNREVTAWTL